MRTFIYAHADCWIAVHGPGGKPRWPISILSCLLHIQWPNTTKVVLRTHSWLDLEPWEKIKHDWLTHNCTDKHYKFFDDNLVSSTIPFPKWTFIWQWTHWQGAQCIYTKHAPCRKWHPANPPQLKPARRSKQLLRMRVWHGWCICCSTFYTPWVNSLLIEVDMNPGRSDVKATPAVLMTGLNVPTALYTPSSSPWINKK